MHFYNTTNFYLFIIKYLFFFQLARHIRQDKNTLFHIIIYLFFYLGFGEEV